MWRQIRPAVVVLIALTVVTGIVYPLTVTALAQLAFRRQANGSLIYRGEELVGSELIGQAFAKPESFWGRLSGTPAFACNAAASSGSNYGPLHPSLQAATQARLDALRPYGGPPAGVPVDLATASASGLDPHISPAAAEYQVARVARHRGWSEEEVRQLVRRHTEGRTWGVLGEPRVNVLQLNLALDARQADGRLSGSPSGR
jgi:potassium-transporting ATPase KdpC subunit